MDRPSGSGELCGVLMSAPLVRESLCLDGSVKRSARRFRPSTGSGWGRRAGALRGVSRTQGRAGRRSKLACRYWPRIAEGRSGSPGRPCWVFAAGRLGSMARVRRTRRSASAPTWRGRLPAGRAPAASPLSVASWLSDSHWPHRGFVAQ